MSFKLTNQQDEIVTTGKTGTDMVIEARAGSGKTSTLRLLAEAVPEKRGVYVAFNAAIADDAKASFPKNTECATAHSFAFRAVGFRYKHRIVRMGAPRQTFKQQARNMGLFSSFPITDELSLNPSQQVSIVKDTLKKFCNSADPTILNHHVKKVEGAEDNMGKLRAYIVPIARRCWENIKDPNGTLLVEDDHYLKMWAMSNPSFNADFILFDEAQDANPVIAQVVLNQTCQKIMVGDSAQAIYGWRGAVDAMSDFARHPGVQTLYLSKSFRFGQAVADEGNKFLTLLGETTMVEGFEQVESTVEPLENPDAILCRTNAGVISYALDYQERGKKVAIVGGTTEILRLAKAARDLLAGKQPWDAEFAAFNSWDEFTQYANEEGDGNLKVFINLVTKYGVEAIIQVCEANKRENSDVDLIVSTAHKAKGREWDSVLIASDFREPKIDEDTGEPNFSKGELMLAYVAVTRAKITLDNTGLAWVNAWV